MTSLLFFVSGITALLFSSRSKKTILAITIILLAGMVFGLAGSVMISYAIDIKPVIWLGQRFVEIAIHTATGFFLLSAAFITLQIRCGYARFEDTIRWLWIPILISSTMAVLTIYMGLSTRAEENRRNTAKATAISISKLLSARLAEYDQALSRMADRVTQLDSIDYETWEPDAIHYLEDFESLQFLNIRNQDGSIDWSYPTSTPDVEEWVSKYNADWEVLEETSIITVPDQILPTTIQLILFEEGHSESETNTVRLCALIDWQMLADRTLAMANDHNHHNRLTATVNLLSAEAIQELRTSAVSIATARVAEDLFWVVAIDPLTTPLSHRLQNFLLATGILVSCLLAVLVHSLQLGYRRLREVKKAEWDLSRNQARLKTFVAHAPASVAMFDREVKYLMASEQWRRDYNIQDTPIIGKSHYEIFPNISEDWKAIHKRCLQGKVEFSNRDRWRPPGMDHDQYLRWEVRPWYEPDGSIGGIMMFTSDVTLDVERETEILAMQEKADEANRMKSQFLANMSHEIRTPMNGVIGMTSILQETNLQPEQKDCVEVIRDSADALLSIIDDILDFSKIEAGKIELEKEQFGITELISTTVELLSPIATRRGNQILPWIELNGPLELIGDSGRLRQILTNLLGNSIKFTENGEIILRIKAVERVRGKVFLSFSISDTGVGMTSEQCDRIFQPFVQADGSTGRKYGGTGLGLSISQRLVEAMGGKLEVTSEPGKGTTFSFQIGFPEAETKTSLSENSAPDQIFNGLACLLVFESSNAGRIVRSQFEKWNINTEIAYTVDSAIQQLKRRPFDFLMVDSNLNAEDSLSKGKKLTEFLAEFAPAPKVIFLKPVDLSIRPEILRKSGIDVILRKPLSPSRLYDAVADATGHENLSKRSSSQDAEGTEQKFELPFRILVAEDNAINRKVITMQLETLGISVDTVSDGAEAVDAWKNLYYPLILMDCQMPGVDGYEATRLIRDAYQKMSDKPRRPYIIALTANALKGDKDQCFAAGMDDYVSKP
ncbi:MAG: ATP-binding protein, partial [Puniceicoccales bacterium]